MKRIILLREKMKQQGLESIIIFSPENINYFTGFTGGSGALLITTNRSILLTDFIYSEQARQQTSIEILEYKGDINNSIKEVIDANNIQNMGFEDNFISYLRYQQIINLSKELIPIKEMIDDLRLIKDDEELNNIRKAVSIGDNAFSYILDFIRPGAAENEIAVELEYFLKKNGAQSLAFDTIVASGQRTSLVHAQPSEKRIEYGDIVLLDFGCKYNGYCSDMTRTVFVGKASDEQVKIYNIVLEAQLRALDYIYKDKTGSEVDKIARDYIIEKGFGENFGHSLGHGVGMRVHENPRLSLNYNRVLNSGMVVTVEPGVYIEAFGGVRIEDMVIIRDNGVENLMKSPKTLTIL